MLLLIIPAIMFFVFFIGMWFEDGEPVYGFLFGILAALVALLVMFCIGMCFQGNPTEIDYSETYEIYALTDNARYSGRVSGNIYLVQSRVEENLKYSYMYRVEGKGFTFEEVPAQDCYLNYTDDTPYVIRNNLKFKNDTLEWLFGYCGNDEYIFYLPANAEVIDDFIIDFE